MHSASHGSRLRDSLPRYDRSSGPGIFSALKPYRWLKYSLYAPNAHSCSIATSCRNYKKLPAMKGLRCPSSYVLSTSSRVSNASLHVRCYLGVTPGNVSKHTCKAGPSYGRCRVAAYVGSAAVGANADPNASTSSHGNGSDSSNKSNDNSNHLGSRAQMGHAVVDQVNGAQPNDDSATHPNTTSAASATAAASVAAVAVAGAVAAAVPAPPPRTTAVRLLRRVMGLLREHFAAVVLLYAVKDALAFLFHRVAQRLTNHAAEVLLGIPTSTAGNPWWLYLDPAFIRAHPGYEVLVGLGFLGSLPITIALSSAAFTAAALIATPPDVRQAAAAAGTTGGSGSAVMPSLSEAAARTSVTADAPAAAVLADLGIVAQAVAGGGASAGAAVPSVASEVHAAAGATSGPGGGPVGQEAAATGIVTEGAVQTEEGPGPGAILRDAAAAIAAVFPAVVTALPRVWLADLQLNLRALPLQGLCLLVLPVLWAAPRLLRLQLTLPVAVLEGRPGREALGRSEGLMTSSLASYGVPFAGLLAAGRLLEYVQGLVMVLVPPRWWREVVEVPLAIAGTFFLLKAGANRLQDLLPLGAYLELSQEQAADAARQQLQLLTPHASKPPTVNSTADSTASDAAEAASLSHATSSSAPLGSRLHSAAPPPPPPPQTSSSGLGIGDAAVEG